MTEFKRLGRDFFIRDTLTVSKQLLGKRVVRNHNGVVLTAMIVETEAYIGTIDAATHAYRGMTERNKVMWEEGGALYVYQIYGMYFCMNVITEPKGIPAGVLIRAVEPLDNIDTMAALRKMNLSTASVYSLTSGPGRVCQALGVTKKENGIDLVTNENIYITEYTDIDQSQIAITPRINIDYAPEAAQYPWRFFIKGNPFVSKHKNNSRLFGES
ncbi:MAG TPA: DNA-3-methyladenine glycosylase [Clostridia bacterium]